MLWQVGASFASLPCGQVRTSRDRGRHGSTRVLPFWVIVHHVHTVSREAAMTWPTRRALLCHVDCGRRERVSAGESDGRCRSRKVWVHTDRVRRGCVQDVAVMTFGVRAKPKAHGWRVVVLSVAEA